MKIVSIFLFLVLLLTPVFYSIGLNVSWVEAKMDALEKISFESAQQQFLLIKFAFKDCPAKESRELYVQGRLYDIARIVKEKDSVSYYVLEDKEEEETMELAFEKFNPDFNVSYTQNLQLSRHKNVLKGLDLLYNFKWAEYNNSPGLLSPFCLWQNNTSVERNSEILTPPPERIGNFLYSI